MTDERLPNALKAEGDWSSIFSYHPMEITLERAKGIYLYGEDGKRYIDASGGPMAVNLGHGDPRMKAAFMDQMDKFAYCHPVMANRKRAELCAKIAEIAPGDLNTTYLVAGGSEAVAWGPDATGSKANEVSRRRCEVIRPRRRRRRSSRRRMRSSISADVPLGSSRKSDDRVPSERTERIRSTHSPR